MRSRVAIYLLIPILIFIGIVITPPSEESLKVETATVVNIQEMIPYELEHTAQSDINTFEQEGRTLRLEEWSLARGARTTYYYVARLRGVDHVVQIDAGAANTRSDGFFAMQAHSPLFETDDPLPVGYPIVLFQSEQPLVTSQIQIRVLYKENESVFEWRIKAE